MFVQVVLVVGTFLLLQKNVNGQSCICKCGPTGLFGEEDLYAKPLPTGPLVVRPKALVKPSISLPLFGAAAKGPCYRRQAIVKPAVVPRPVYTQTQTQTQTCNSNSNLASAVAAAAQILAQSSGAASTNTNVISQGVSQAATAIASGSGFQQAIQGAQGIDVSSAYHQACSGAHQPSAPADAVSLAMAYKLSHNNYNKKIAEDRLAYGFRKLPIEQPQLKRKVYKNILPEESLYTLNGQIVELKPVSEQTSCDSLADEAEEELLDLAISEEAAGDVHVARRPSLGELGYAPAKVSATTFIDIPSIAPPPELPTVPVPILPCNDGFKSGTVEYKDISKHEQVHANGFIKKDDTSCESAEEAVRNIPIPAPSCQCNYDGNVAGLVHSFSSLSKSSSSCSSSSASHKKNIVLEKLCS